MQPAREIMSAYANVKVLDALRALLDSIVRVDILTYDYADEELSRKKYLVKPGDRIEYSDPAPKGTRWFVAVGYDAEDRYIYKNFFSAHEGNTFTFIVPTGANTRFED